MTVAPLKGIRIIDLSMGWAGPLAARHLADMGADVIKIESCERFDWWRSWEATPEWIEDDGAEKSTAFNLVNRNKRNVTLDLEDDEGRHLLLRLVATANAVIENYAGGVLGKLGLDFDTFRAVREDIVLVSMPAFGSTGPWAKFRAYGSTVEHSSGLPHLNGTIDDAPAMHHVAYGDAVGGLNGASALLVALRAQARTGKGQFVDLSQSEGLMALGAHGVMEFAATGKTPARRGNAVDHAAPYGTYRCAGEDRWILIQVFNDTQWDALKSEVGESVASFGDLGDRTARRVELDEALTVWTTPQDADALTARLQALSIPAMALSSPGRVLNDPHLSARGFWQWKDRAVVGLQPNPSPPYRTAADPIKLRSPAPTLGQHNEEVLGGVLGLGEEELRRLTERGVIGKKPRMPSKA